MLKLPDFIKRAVERAIHDASNPQGMHTNGPCMARIEVSQLNALLQRATQEIVIGVDCLDDNITSVVVMSRVKDITTVTGEATVQRGKSGIISF